MILRVSPRKWKKILFLGQIYRKGRLLTLFFWKSDRLFPFESKKTFIFDLVCDFVHYLTYTKEEIQNDVAIHILREVLVF